MINLFEKYDGSSRDFLFSQKTAKIKIPSVAMVDDGFLPDDVDSPFKYFCNLTDNHDPLYFDQLKIPYYWRILSTASEGRIYDLDKRKAQIFYSSTNNTRLVKEVRWSDDIGPVSWVDHYNNHGHLFAKTYYENGQAKYRKYFDNHGKIVIEWNLTAGDIFLDTKKIHRHFTSLPQFVTFYLQLRKYNLDHIFYNSLSYPLWVMDQLPANGSDTLFWNEDTGAKIPGKMQYLLDKKTRTKHIVFQRHRDWMRRRELFPNGTGNVDDLQYLGMIYPHPRGNKLQPSILIMTNSDQIDHLDELVRAMPNIQFHIAAVTEMSGKLLAFGERPNVTVYPNVSRQRALQLLKDCDVYLDINRGSEILDSVRAAFEQNMLILGFKDTLHEPQFVAPQNIFDQNQAKEMTQKILTALLKPALMEKLIDTQREHANDATVEQYKEVIGVLTNGKAR